MAQPGLATCLAVGATESVPGESNCKVNKSKLPPPQPTVLFKKGIPAIDPRSLSCISRLPLFSRAVCSLRPCQDEKTALQRVCSLSSWQNKLLRCPTWMTGCQ